MRGEQPVSRETFPFTETEKEATVCSFRKHPIVSVISGMPKNRSKIREARTMCEGN